MRGAVRYEARDVLARSREELERLVLERTREREEALAQLHEAQKLETIGQLTGGVAHDFNNLLTPVMGNLDLLRRRIPADDARSQRLVENALQATSRAATLVQRLLAFARRQDLQPKAVDVSELLAGIEDLVTRSIGPTIAVNLKSSPICLRHGWTRASSSLPCLISPSTREMRCLGAVS